MKINSRKLLLSLYFLKKNNPNGVPTTMVDILFPGLLPATRRSLIFQLNKKGLINTNKLFNKTTYAISQMGEQYLFQLYPTLLAVNPVEASAWLGIIENLPAAHDPGFRRFQELLLLAKAIKLKKGFYLIKAEKFPSIKLPLTKYYQSIVVFEVGGVLLGELGSLYSDRSEVRDWLRLLSGVSSEVDKLIAKDLSFSRATDQQKITLLSVYERFFSLFESFPGLDLLSFQQQELFLTLVKKLPKLIA